MKTLDFDVIIVGAGAIGAAMAALLVSRKLSAPGRVALIADRFMGPPPADADWDLRVFALSRASEHLLKACGVWASLPSQRVHAMNACASGTPAANLREGIPAFDCAEVGEPNLGYIVDGRALQWQCLQAARGAGVVAFEAKWLTLRSIRRSPWS